MTNRVAAKRPDHEGLGSPERRLPHCGGPGAEGKRQGWRAATLTGCAECARRTTRGWEAPRGG